MHRVTEYCSWVTRHPSQCCEYVKLAVKRYKEDLKKSKDPSYPYRFDRAKAQKFLDFTECLKQYKDQWSGQPLHLEPWQAFVFSQIYGWVRKDNGLRRFRKAFVFVARKNGKSTMMSSVLLWDILTTSGAEGYCAATKKDQAKIVFESVCQMVQQNPSLASRLHIYPSTSTIVNMRMAGKIAALSSDNKRFDGLNPSCVVIDEVAAMPDYKTIQILQSGTGSRPEPLIFEITSGSDDTNSAGHQEFERSEKILQGSIEDDSFFCMLYTLDKGDKWTDRRVWIKANPNLGVSVRPDTMEKLCIEAEQNPSLEGEFRIKNLCQFISPVTAWISYKSWNNCIQNAQALPPVKDLDLNQCICTAAVDLSMRIDFTSFVVMVYHIPSKKFYALHKFYIPEEQVFDKCKSDTPMVRKWIEQGYINATPGSVVDYSYIFQDIKAAITEFNIKEIMYDPWNAGQLISQIGPFVDLVEVRQTTAVISPMAKDYEAAIINSELVDGNPVMRWMISNCDIYRDPNGNIKPEKHGGKDSPLHIDGVVTSLMAMGRIKQLLDGGFVDTRSAEEIQADMESRLSAIEY